MSRWGSILKAYADLKASRGKLQADDWLSGVVSGAIDLLSSEERAALLDARIWSDVDGTSLKFPEWDPATALFESLFNYRSNHNVHQSFGFLAWNDSWPDAIELSEGDHGDVSLAEGVPEYIWNTTSEEGWKAVENTLILDDAYKTFYREEFAARQKLFKAKNWLGDVESPYLNESFLEAKEVEGKAAKIHEFVAGMVGEYRSIFK